MSKNTIIIITTLLIVCAIGVFYFTKSDNVTQKELSTTPEVQNILLYTEKRGVSFKIPGSKIFEKATSSPTIIPNQTTVHTDSSNASVLLPDNSLISIDKDTEIIVSYAEKSTSIYQAFGSTYSRVEKLLSGSTYQVQTPGTLAAVRGTKFAVKYDIKTKKTKVAVTENKVQVSTIPQTIGTTTPPLPETIEIVAGKTVDVETVISGVKAKPSTMKVVDIKDDKEMNNWVNTNKENDAKIEKIKKETTDEKEYRKEIRKNLFNDNTDENKKESLPEDKNVIKDENKNEIKTETKETTKNEAETKTDVKKEDTPREATVDNSDQTTTTPFTSVKKINEEEFFNVFNDMFIKYFYIDDTDSTCLLKITPEERVRIINSYTINSGYSLEGTDLLPFAQAINSYCSQKDSATKIILQGRFDDEFPFKQNI